VILIILKNTPFFLQKLQCHVLDLDWSEPLCGLTGFVKNRQADLFVITCAPKIQVQ
jgi:hypothetical protein